MDWSYRPVIRIDVFLFSAIIRHSINDYDSD